MFNILKNKLKKVVESVTKRLESKEAGAQKEVPLPELPKTVEELEMIEKPEIVEEPEMIEEKIEEPERIEEPETVGKLEKVEVPEMVEEKPKESLFKKVFKRVVKKVTVRELDERDIGPILNELETDLIESDVAVAVAEKIKLDLRDSLVGAEIKRGEEESFVVDSLKRSLTEILSVPEVDLKRLASEKKPAMLLFLGFNGSGKTTSLAKCAKWLMDNGYSCVFAAADTFRAASIEQLEEHANNLGVKVIKHKYGADPAAVVYDAMGYAKAKGVDFVLADTAGRINIDKDLIEELKKMCRVNKPDLKILVLDSMTGNDILLQSQFFNDAVGIDAIIFTKMDVNPKGGNLLTAAHTIKKPILFIGSGQDYDNLEKYNPERIVNLMLE